MATQGLVSEIRQGRVVLKVVAGCNGFQAPVQAQWLRERARLRAERQEYTTLQEVYDAALALGFGCRDCLVAMNGPDGRWISSPDMDEIPERYSETFDDPTFNPRWARGTAEYTEVVEVEDTPDVAWTISHAGD